MGAPDSLDLKPEVRDAIRAMVDMGRGRFDEWDAECAQNAVLKLDRALAEVKRLRAERDEVRKSWAEFKAASKPLQVVLRMSTVPSAAVLDRLLGGAE